MKRTLMVFLSALLLIALPACAKGSQEEGSQGTAVSEEALQGVTASGEPLQGAAESEEKAKETEPAVEENEEMRIYAHVGEHVLEIEPENNSSADAFLALLAEGDVTVAMHDYGNFEKVGPLGTSLPTNDTSITTAPGDVILYQGDQITIYYDTNSWNFTRLGKVRGLTQTELKDVLGAGDVTVVFSLSDKESEGSAPGSFDLEKKTVLLNSGYEMPIMGLGTYSLDHDTCIDSVKALLENGGRLIDTAYMYHNEEAVGEGVRQAMEEFGIPREEVFVITKIYPSQFNDPKAAIDLALLNIPISS